MKNERDSKTPLKSQGGKATMTSCFLEWLKGIYDAVGQQSYYQFIRDSGLCGDTSTRWRNGTQVPTTESIEKTVRAYAVHSARAEGLEDELASEHIEKIVRDVLIKLVGADGYVEQLRKEKDAAIAKLKAKDKESARSKK